MKEARFNKLKWRQFYFEKSVLNTDIWGACPRIENIGNQLPTHNLFKTKEIMLVCLGTVLNLVLFSHILNELLKFKIKKLFFWPRKKLNKVNIVK